MFEPTQSGGTPPDAHLSFTYFDHQITINATGLIRIESHADDK